MGSKEKEILQELLKCYEALGDELYLLAALMSYADSMEPERLAETSGTNESCLIRLAGYIELHAQEVTDLSEELMRTAGI